MTGMNRTVLFVDDEEAIRDVTKTLLEQVGYQVLTAADGQKGFEVFHKNPEAIDLAILDYNMPGLTGSELMFKMKNIRPKMPVIIYSGVIRDEKNADLVLTKPCSASDFIKAVGSMFSR